tara:strand:+ start:500 stop:682 length:183 start_codon:yes stop_codon:yes gene_type:complete
MKNKKSPCVSICKFVGKNNWCIGCGRTLEECKEWKKMKPFARNRLNKELEKRMILINEYS